VTSARRQRGGGQSRGLKKRAAGHDGIFHAAPLLARRAVFRLVWIFVTVPTFKYMDFTFS